MCNDDLPIHNQEVISTITGSIISEDFWQNNQYVITFISNDMISRFEEITNRYILSNWNHDNKMASNTRWIMGQRK